MTIPEINQTLDIKFDEKEEASVPDPVLKAIEEQFSRISLAPPVSSKLFAHRHDYTFGSKAPFSLRDLIVERLKTASPPLTLLDVGCGPGLVVSALNKSFPDQIQAAGLDVKKTGDYDPILGNAQFLDQIETIRTKQYDWIVSTGTVRHLVDPLLFLKQAYLKLKENGCLIVDRVILPGLKQESLASLLKKEGYSAEAEVDREGHCQFLKITKTKPAFLLPIAYAEPSTHFGNAQYRIVHFLQK